jgi:hypothetical protein
MHCDVATFMTSNCEQTLASVDNLFCNCLLGSVHNSSASKILSAKAWLQGEKHSKVEHLASIFNAAGAFLSQNIAA